MNFFSKSLLSIATVILAGQVFANQTNAECLPSSTIANITFTKAFKDRHPNTNIWAMVSDNLKFQNREWNVVFAAVLSNVNSPQEALEKGTAYFNTISLKDAQPLVFGQQVVCEYASSNKEYVVIAAAPPFNLEGSVNVARKLK